MNLSTGWFEVSGESAQLRLEPEGWLVGTAPTHCDAVSLLREQPNLKAPVKAMDTGRLRAEVPCRGDVGSSFLVIHTALEQSLHHLAGFEPKAREEAAAEPRVTDLLESSGYEFTEEIDAWVVTLASDPYRPRTARIETAGDAWIARTELARLRDPAPVSIQALEHFLLALNGRLRFARSSLVRDTAVLEVVYPADSLSADIVDKALGALAVGADWAHRECRALSDASLAKRYLSFHQQKTQGGSI